MYKSRHSGWWRKHERVRAKLRVRGFLTLQHIFTNQDYSRNRKPMVIKHSCHIVPSDAIKVLPLVPFKNSGGWSPGWMKYRNKQCKRLRVSTPASSPHACATFTNSWTSPMQCVTVLCLWMQRSLAVPSIRALQVSLSSRRESKKTDSTVQN